MAAADPQLAAITPAMCEGSGMVAFSEQELQYSTSGLPNSTP